MLGVRQGFGDLCKGAAVAVELVRNLACHAGFFCIAHVLCQLRHAGQDFCGFARASRRIAIAGQIVLHAVGDVEKVAIEFVAQGADVAVECVDLFVEFLQLRVLPGQIHAPSQGAQIAQQQQHKNPDDKADGLL